MTILNDTNDPNNAGTLRHDGNELFNDSKVNDPGAYRLGKRVEHAKPGDTAIGFQGFDLVAADGSRQSLVQIIGRIDDRYPVGPKGESAAGEVEIFIRAPNIGSHDSAQKRRARIRHDGIEVWVGPEPGGQYVPLGTGGPVTTGGSLPVGTRLVLRPTTDAVFEVVSAGPSVPVPPPVPTPPPLVPNPDPPPAPVPHGEEFVFGDRQWFCANGDFGCLERAFGFALERSDIDAYLSDRYTWREVIAIMQRRAA